MAGRKGTKPGHNWERKCISFWFGGVREKQHKDILESEFGI
jgi:hypothetical protein